MKTVKGQRSKAKRSKVTGRSTQRSKVTKVKGKKGQRSQYTMVKDHEVRGQRSKVKVKST